MNTTSTSSRSLSIPKIRFYNNGDEVRREPAPMRCGLRAGWRDGSERLCQVTDEPQLVIISGILRQDPSQVRFAQDDSMVDTLATDRSDQSFGGPWSDFRLPRPQEA
jgi:hypothetical protein